jgi:hypothetical protein
MIKLAIKLGTLAPVLVALSTAPSLTPALAVEEGVAVAVVEKPLPP